MEEKNDDVVTEKEDLQALNQRLASLINQGILSEQELISELNTRNVSELRNIKDSYEHEMGLLRKRLEEVIDSKSQLEYECSIIHKENNDLKNKYEDLYKRYQCAESNLNLAENKVIIIEESLSKSEKELKKIKMDFKKLQDNHQVSELEMENIKLDFTETKTRLLKEELEKVNFMNALKALKEEISFKENIHLKKVSVWSIPSQEGIETKTRLEKLQNDFKMELAKVKETLKTEYCERVQLLENEKKLMLQNKEEEINHLKNTLRNYKALYPDVSIQPEIEIYRYLLEIGETSFVPSSVVNDNKDEVARGSDYVEILDVHPDGFFVKIQNIGNNATNISGWRLIQTNELQEKNIFKFKSETLIDPGCSITVWSSNAVNIPNIPTNIVMKKQNWCIGNEMKTLLLNTNCLEISTFKISKGSKFPEGEEKDEEI